MESYLLIVACNLQCTTDMCLVIPSKTLNPELCSRAGVERLEKAALDSRTAVRRTDGTRQPAREAEYACI